MAGEYNVWNATAAAALAAACGISKEAIAAALKTFKSVKRRLEVKAQVNGVTIIDDFAHHPTAIAGTLKALRARYPERACGRFWNRGQTRCAGACCRAIWRAVWRRPMKSSSRVCFVPKQFRKMSGWICRNSRPKSSNMAAAARFLPTRTQSFKPSRPELRSGDVVAILSNGGFGGIYEKLPAAPPGARSRSNETLSELIQARSPVTASARVSCLSVLGASSLAQRYRCDQLYRSL